MVAGVLGLVLGWVTCLWSVHADPPSPVLQPVPTVEASPATAITTPAPVADLSGQVVEELNRVRTQPALYAGFLAGRRSAYGEDKALSLPGRPRLRTQEGLVALDEAIAALRALTAPLPALAADERLARVARELADDQAKGGATGHVGSDGAGLAIRVARQGEVDGAAGENVAYGAGTTAVEIVFGLVVDDGVAGRGHRQNLLNGDLRLVGVANAAHAKWGQVCVIDPPKAGADKDGHGAGRGGIGDGGVDLGAALLEAQEQEA